MERCTPIERGMIVKIDHRVGIVKDVKNSEKYREKIESLTLEEFPLQNIVIYGNIRNDTDYIDVVTVEEKTSIIEEFIQKLSDGIRYMSKV